MVEADTESESDDNHSNQDAQSAQRSVQTGATAGSDTGYLWLYIICYNNYIYYRDYDFYFSFVIDESGESSQPEEEGSENGDTDELSTAETIANDELLERRMSVW